MWHAELYTSELKGARSKRTPREFCMRQKGSRNAHWPGCFVLFLALSHSFLHFLFLHTLATRPALIPCPLEYASMLQIHVHRGDYNCRPVLPDLFRVNNRDRPSLRSLSLPLPFSLTHILGASKLLISMSLYTRQNKKAKGATERDRVRERETPSFARLCNPGFVGKGRRHFARLNYSTLPHFHPKCWRRIQRSETSKTRGRDFV